MGSEYGQKEAAREPRGIAIKSQPQIRKETCQETRLQGTPDSRFLGFNEMHRGPEVLPEIPLSGRHGHSMAKAPLVCKIGFQTGVLQRRTPPQV
ncbi:hypothetical protein BpHYR1_016055 [Brachionus plicatilis]|uniref:Uncharacterized protein n=1 Tax=Brachionus plicatilis TaxID=10195 RepID=A0A3M7RS89_BRAPC|nr:hypothetical protein BpHYR1_016055 [Brachionus plicatilis]